jgi:phosphoribosylglycinamide formyltransferase-1
MDLNVHAAVLAAGETETGCTVHVVTAGVDAGPIIVQKKCPVAAGDTPETLKQKVQVRPSSLR